MNMCVSDADQWVRAKLMAHLEACTCRPRVGALTRVSGDLYRADVVDLNDVIILRVEIDGRTGVLARIW